MFYEFKYFGSSEYLLKEFGSNLTFPHHLHQYYELIVILSGTINATVGNKSYSANKNEAILIFPNQIHSFTSHTCNYIMYIFAPELVNSFFTKTANKTPLNNKFSLDDYMINALSALSENDSRLKKKGVLYSVCAVFDETAEYSDKCNEEKNLLHTIFKFVESNYDKDCSLERLSAETTYSYSYLSRYFKNTVGISFNSYVNRYRISRACYILENSACTILQCALECGYNSLRSFNRNFMSVVSVSPKEYREQTKKR